jgi:anti-anti-sigma regulatory factor
VLTQVLAQLEAAGVNGIRNVICDLSASPMMDLAGARMLDELYENLRQREIGLTIVNAHGRVRDLLRAEGFGAKIQGIARGATIADALSVLADEALKASPFEG